MYIVLTQGGDSDDDTESVGSGFTSIGFRKPNTSMLPPTSTPVPKERLLRDTATNISKQVEGQVEDGQKIKVIIVNYCSRISIKSFYIQVNKFYRGVLNLCIIRREPYQVRKIQKSMSKTESRQKKLRLRKYQIQKEKTQRYGVICAPLFLLDQTNFGTSFIQSPGRTGEYLSN